MGKKVKELEPEGSPAYMGLYASLMTILLSFFILLNTMTEDQEAGFKEGIGRVRNAFGLRGGYGLLNYMQMVRGRSKVQVKEEAKAGELSGTPKDLTIGKGGSGNVDQDTDNYSMDRYVQVKVSHEFPRNQARISEELAEYLDTIGTTMQLFDFSISVKCISMEYEDDNIHRARRIAAKRAAAIMLYLHQRCNIPLTRLRSTGYTGRQYFASLPKPKKTNEEVPPTDDRSKKVSQMTFLCIYRNPQPAN